jgi:hypothetical protein
MWDQQSGNSGARRMLDIALEIWPRWGSPGGSCSRYRPPFLALRRGVGQKESPRNSALPFSGDQSGLASDRLGQRVTGLAGRVT